MTDTRVQITHEEGWDLEEGMMVDGGVVCLKGLLAVFYIFQDGGAKDETWKKYSSGFVETIYFDFEIWADILT